MQKSPYLKARYRQGLAAGAPPGLLGAIALCLPTLGRPLLGISWRIADPTVPPGCETCGNGLCGGAIALQEP